MVTTPKPVGISTHQAFANRVVISKPPRLDSVDLLRGLVMVIMALDHTREFFTNLRIQPEDLTQTFGSLFFTRWITHFCAPLFFFLAGTGMFLSTSRGKNAAQLSSFLIKRGLWLVFLELTVIAFAWTFIPRISTIFIVIWALGWSMVAMALIVRLPMPAITTLGVVMIAGHNLLDKVLPTAFGKLSWLWIIMHRPGFFPLHATFLPPKSGVFVLYPLVPWIGVMACGYALGPVLKRATADRRRLLLMIGGVTTLAFIVLRATNLYGNAPTGWFTPAGGPFVPQKTALLTLIAFLNVEKYPPSLQFLLMTLGPGIMMLAWFDRFDFRSAPGKVWEKVLVYGRVPMFYYVLHIFLIHSMAVVVGLLSHQPIGWLLHGGFFGARVADNYGHGLLFVYAMWILAVALLYYPCKWFAALKQRRKDWWLSYI